MKTIESRIDYPAVILAVMCLFHPVIGHSAEKQSERDNVTTNVAHQTTCELQLNRIHGAIQEYVKRNQRLPRWLSDLVPDYIHDPKTLVCPFVEQTGRFKEWRTAFVNYPVFADPGFCSYAYEFCTTEITSVPGLTTRDYKQHQMAMIGFGVPVVRCLAHRPILNLAYDGSTYLSPDEWEDDFAISPKHHKAFHDVWSMTLTKRSLNKIILDVLEPRDPKAGPSALDLSSHYNASLLHLSRIELSGKLLIHYPEGLRRIDGVDFDIRALIHLTATNFPIPFPEKAGGIPVNQKCTSLHFLHGAMFPATDGIRIASYVLRFGDGTTDEVPVIYGRDVKTRWFDPKIDPAIDNPKAAWVSPPDKIGATGKSLRLYVTHWKNPGRDSELRSIDFISHMTPSAPFLVAITVE
jgi:hypothetical protein